MKYAVKLTFKYSDIVHVEADTEEEAIEKAMVDCKEEYECFYDAEVSRENSIQTRRTKGMKMKQSFKATVNNGRLRATISAPSVSIGIQECFVMVVDEKQRKELIAELIATDERMTAREKSL